MADMIRFKCKACEKKISVRAQYAGKKAKCPGCKQPLRVPSPRPKRTESGSPVAAGAVRESSSASRSGSGMTMAELVAMEENADAQIRELYPKAPSGPSAPRIQGGKDCPDCESPLTKDAVICVYCGHNFKDGKKLKTYQQSMLGKAFASMTGSANAGEDPYRKNRAAWNGFWRLGLPGIVLIVFGIAIMAGAFGFIRDQSEGFKAAYESVGAVPAGGVVALVGVICVAVWKLTGD